MRTAKRITTASQTAIKIFQSLATSTEEIAQALNAEKEATVSDTPPAGTGDGRSSRRRANAAKKV